jgi:curved DNA-binding protein CbpA
VVLGVDRGASQIEVRQAYLSLIREHSPEKDPQAFKTIHGAYEQLRTPEARGETDLFLLRPPPAWQPPPLRLDFDLAFHAQDAVTALESWGEMGRTDFTDDFREVKI